LGLNIAIVDPLIVLIDQLLKLLRITVFVFSDAILARCKIQFEATGGKTQGRYLAVGLGLNTTIVA
jgi:hypothetical protein